MITNEVFNAMMAEIICRFVQSHSSQYYSGPFIWLELNILAPGEGYFYWVKSFLDYKTNMEMESAFILEILFW